MQESHKKLFIITISAVLTGVVFAFAKRRVNPKGYSALFIGDSHTALYGNGWQDTLAKIYGFKVINLSQVGKTTGWMFTTLKNYLDKNPAPDMLFIYGGANDIYGKANAKTVFNNIQRMVNLGIQKGIKSNNIFIISGYRTARVTDGSKYAQGGFPERMDAFKEALKTQITQATIVPIWEEGTNKDSGDGLHINSQAQARFAKFIGSKIF